MNDYERLAGESEYSKNASDGPEKSFFRQRKYITSKLHLLPPRQELYLRLALSGLSSRDIAKQLKVKCHRSIRRSINNAVKTIKGISV